MTASPQPAASATERDAQGCLALDQWRGLALVLVLVSHAFYFSHRVDGFGRVGVNLFFFISGILVYRTLSRSRSRAANNWEFTRSFWWRRLRRLHPALIVYALIMLVASWWLQRIPNLPMHNDFPTVLRSIGPEIFYLGNYLRGAMCYGHLWSLACEMQFYLLAPLIFLAGGSGHIRRMVVFGCALAILLITGTGEITFPMLGWYFGDGWGYRFEFAAWPMMAGFFCEYRRDWFSRLPETLVSVVLWSSVAVCAIAFALMVAGFKVKFLVIAVGLLLLLPCLLMYLHGRPWHYGHGRSLRWLGERTYSIYLWQEPLTICGYLPNFLHPLGALASVFVGAISFRFVEYPFLSANRKKQQVGQASRPSPSEKAPA